MPRLTRTSTDDIASTSADALIDATALMTARRAADAYKKRAPPRTKYVNARFSVPAPAGRRDVSYWPSGESNLPPAAAPDGTDEDARTVRKDRETGAGFGAVSGTKEHDRTALLLE